MGADAEPALPADVEVLAAGVEIEQFAPRVAVVKRTVAGEYRFSVRTGFDHRESIEDPPVTVVVRFERFHDEPLLRKQGTNFAPFHRQSMGHIKCASKIC